jgi:hypothetical protein
MADFLVDFLADLLADLYRVFAEVSPYSVKVRGYFRYKGIPHQWILRNAESEADHAKYARLPIVPLDIDHLFLPY